MLKTDLLISTRAQDDYLAHIVEFAQKCIETEGITVEDNVEDGMLIERYAAYIYRTRREPSPMPRNLRWALNNRLFSEKGAVTDG